MKNFIYSKKIKVSIKIVSVIAILILALVNFLRLVNLLLGKVKTDFYFWSVVISNFLVMSLFVFVFIYPHKFSLIALACLFYAVSIIPYEQFNPMGVLMFDLAMVILNIRGFFRAHAKIKVALFILLLIALHLPILRFGPISLMTAFIESIGFSFVFFMGIFFAYGYASRNAPEEKILNIAKYEGLKESDADMLRRVLDNQQYKVIAIDLQKSEGTIRNRLNKVYDILGVADRVGFITTFTGYELIYKPEIEITENQVEEAAAQSKPQQN